MQQNRLLSTPTKALIFACFMCLFGAACDSEPDQSTGGASAGQENPATGVRLVTAAEGESIRTNAPADLVVLDVRTPEEYAEGHLPGATLIDFYDADFADQIAGLDPNVPYLLYCRSGNRSGQTAELMEELGFVDVADIDGGIIAWNDAGLSTMVE